MDISHFNAYDIKDELMKLVLFFTRGISLESWVDLGLFDREKLIYEEHLKRSNCEKIYWITYGNNDRQVAEKLKKQGELHKDIEICEMPTIFKIPKIGSYLYSFLVPFYHRKIFKECDILKTNQMDGSWGTLLVKWIYRKPLLLRTGFTQSIFLIKQNRNKMKILYSKFIEKMMYRNCDFATIGSEKDKQYISDSYNINPNKIKVLFNYIDIDIFKNLNLERKDKIAFVGRLSEQKNLYSLIEAMNKTDFILDIYGQGELKDGLQKFAFEKDANVNFMGVVSNKDLPNILNQYKYYILPSYYEGMPKTLLEAMACGCVCIGTNVEGINEVIKDKYNGFLIHGVDPGAISDFLQQLPSLTKTHKDISENGVKTIEESFSLDAITEKEQQIMKELYESNTK